MVNPVKKVAVTGAAGQIAYSLLFRIAAGDLLGLNQPIALSLLDLPELEGALKGIVMELEDCAFPLLHSIRIGSVAEEMFEDVHYALLIGARPRKPGMERKDLLTENGKIFAKQGQALNQTASKDVRVLVVGNPCNTNCLIAIHHAPNLSPSQFFAMTRLDQNRAIFQLANKAGVLVSEVRRMAIWGNHSATQVPDFVNATILGKKAVDVISDRKWLEGEFTSRVQKRGAAVLDARGKSSAASASHAILGSIRSLACPTPSHDSFSLAVMGEKNPYGLPEDLVFSFPCRSLGKGDWEIVPGFHIDPFLRLKLDATCQELIGERDFCLPWLKPSI